MPPIEPIGSPEYRICFAAAQNERSDEEIASFWLSVSSLEIVPPDTEHLIGNFWQIKVDGVLKRDLLFSSS